MTHRPPNYSADKQGCSSLPRLLVLLGCLFMTMGVGCEDSGSDSSPYGGPENYTIQIINFSSQPVWLYSDNELKGSVAPEGTETFSILASSNNGAQDTALRRPDQSVLFTQRLTLNPGVEIIYTVAANGTVTASATAGSDDPDFTDDGEFQVRISNNGIRRVLFYADGTLLGDTGARITNRWMLSEGAHKLEITYEDGAVIFSQNVDQDEDLFIRYNVKSDGSVEASGGRL